MRRALIVLAGLSLAGCRGHHAAPANASDDAGAGAGAAGSATVGPATRVLQPERHPPPPTTPMPRRVSEALLEAGAAPRRALRYRLEPAARTLTAISRITSHGYDGGWTDPVTLAPVHEGFEVTPAGGGGPVHVRGVIAEVEADGQSDAARTAAEAYLARWRAVLERRRADLVVDERGGLGEVTLLTDPGGTTDPDAKDELVQRWLGLAVPLPEAPVGVGARWKVVTMLRAGGAVMTQTAIYRLARVDRDRWTIEVDLTRLGRPQEIQLPGQPPGATAQLVALLRKVTGTVTVSPASPLPLDGQLTGEVRSQARIPVAGGPPRDQASEDTASITLSTAPSSAASSPAAPLPAPSPTAPPTALP
ncbi:MAG TPA: hypothetical protein VHE35_16130 [Kofleriaceae bacterium]|nr:hypothetical protein [Kofleriaceae bacterium]